MKTIHIKNLAPKLSFHLQFLVKSPLLLHPIPALGGKVKS